MRLNIGKTKASKTIELEIQEEEIEQLDIFKYLKLVIQSSGEQDKDTHLKRIIKEIRCES